MLAEHVTTIASVQNWSVAWLCVFIVGGVFFLGILAYSVITGAKDIKDLFVSLAASAGDQQQEADKKAATSQPSTQQTETEAEARK